MKNPPTLADICVASALDKRVYPGSGEGTKMIREILLKVSRARKLVLDDNMSEFLADLHDGIIRGGMRKRQCALENARRLSRLPHALTWIEFNYPKLFDRLTFVKGYEVQGFHGPHPSKLGWLLEQHPTNEAAFRRVEIWSSVSKEGIAFMHPVSMAWCSDDEPSPWRRWPIQEDTSGAAVVEGYSSMQAHLMATFTPDISTSMLNEFCRGRSEADTAYVSKNSTTLRTTWALLATINDLPVTIERVEPSKGYVARGQYKKFLEHSVVHLTVPETRWRKLVLKAAAILRRRAHQVRGHWRRDWRNPLAPVCQHEFDEQMTCKHCRGKQLWIAEHQRGDASMGFVTHDYEVHHDDI